MKASIVLLAAISLVSAQQFGAEPSCAIPCLASAISVAGCAANDQGCQCGTGQAAIQTAVTPCLLTACNFADLNSAASVGFALCSVYSAGIASANATTTRSSTTAIVTTTGFPNATTALTSSTGSTSASGSTGSTGSTTRAPTSTGSSTRASSTTGASSSSSAAGAAMASMMAGLGGVAALVGGAVALL